MLLWFAMLLDKTPKYSNDIKGTMTKQHFSNNLSENRTFIAHIDSLRSPQSHTYTLNMQAKSTQRISLHSVQNEMPSDCAQNSYLDQYVVFIIANFTHPFSAHHTSALVPKSHPLTSLPSTLLYRRNVTVHQEHLLSHTIHDYYNCGESDKKIILKCIAKKICFAHRFARSSKRNIAYYERRQGLIAACMAQIWPPELWLKDYEWQRFGSIGGGWIAACRLYCLQLMDFW